MVVNFYIDKSIDLAVFVMAFVYVWQVPLNVGRRRGIHGDLTFQILAT